MGMNQFRRNPITGQWSIIVEDKYDLQDLLATHNVRKNAANGQVNANCQFCTGFETETPPEIFSVRHNKTMRNEPGWTVRVIPDRQPFLQIYGELNNRGVGIYDILDGIGAHELVIESPDHDIQLFNMKLNEIEDVLSAYRERIMDLKKDTRFRYVLIHKNYGEGTENVVNHAHSHIIATPITPTRVKTELMNALEHYKYKERCIFCDIMHQELADDERVILQNDKFLALSPFASRSPFTVWLMPKQHETFFEWNTEHNLLASILQVILQRINDILNNPNFVMALHSGPNLSTGKLRGYWKTVERDYHWHIEITPRFRGFTGFDIGAGFNINVVSPERATKILKAGKID